MDVCGIGSALVDILVEATSEQIADWGLVKGSMQLTDLAASERIHALTSGGVERSGGSCANSIAGLAVLGARTAFIGRIAQDRLGKVFGEGLGELGVVFADSPTLTTGTADDDGATGRSLILITPDGDRTMCTTLGVAPHLAIDHLDKTLIGDSQITYLEGYLWDEAVAINALRAAIDLAHAAGRQTALSLSDPFCVDRHREEWQELIATSIDLLFGNEAELCSLTETTDLKTACERIRRPGLTASITRGALGAWTFRGDAPVVETPASPVERVVDTTGAGDLYAAGFMFGLVRGRDLPTCAQIGAVAAAEVISHIGGRPIADLAALVAPLL